MLTIRISLGRWVFDCDFGRRPEDDELVDEAPEEGPAFGFGSQVELAEPAEDAVFRDLD